MALLDFDRPKTTQERANAAAAAAKTARGADIKEGENLANKYFNTAENSDLMARYKAMANGLSDPEYATLRDRGNADINTAMQTGLRSLRGVQAASGVRGGAAGAQALNFLGNINSQKQKLASDLSAQDIALKRQGLNDYASYYTGDRAGRVGTIFGNAGLGATDRSNAQQFVLGQDFINAQRQNLANAQGMQVPGAFDPLQKLGSWNPNGPGFEDLVASPWTVPIKAYDKVAQYTGLPQVGNPIKKAKNIVTGITGGGGGSFW